MVTDHKTKAGVHVNNCTTNTKSTTQSPGPLNSGLPTLSQTSVKHLCENRLSEPDHADSRSKEHKGHENKSLMLIKGFHLNIKLSSPVGFREAIIPLCSQLWAVITFIRLLAYSSCKLLSHLLQVLPHTLGLISSLNSLPQLLCIFNYHKV